MNYIKRDGTNNNVIFLLHGTGGDASSLLDIGHAIDPHATLIGIEGDVLEQGMRRYFKRYTDGSFDLENLKEETYRLYVFMQQLLKEHNLASKQLSIMGYSNGSNIAINLFKEIGTVFKLGLLFHPSLGRGNIPFQVQSNLTLFLSHGTGDPYIKSEEFDSLVSQVKEAHIDVELLRHEYGHQLLEAELVKAKEIYQRVMH